MKFLVPLLLALLAVTASYASPHYPREAEEQDDATEEYWKGRLGWVLEQLGKWLQQSAGSSSYSSQDAESTGTHPLRTVTELLKKVVDAAKKD
uniref:Putative secreted protein n=1 Tax=Amblyomma triste TaxID=251400 RepID=A0A023G9C2_AMBTT